MFLLSLSFAHAFCGTYVGGADASLSNHASRIGIAREGTRTTLTLFNDFEGDSTDFAMLVPVPEVLGPEDVKTSTPEVIARWDGFSAPREVAYKCEDFMETQYPQRSMGCYQDYALEGSMDAGAMDDTAGGVQVEAEFTVGAYDIVILSAEESSGLLNWLNGNGYAVSENSASLLQNYIDGGSYFFAAKVHLEQIEVGSKWLPPLQFSYDSPVFGLPIRLGTLNGSATQDLLLYILTSPEDGGVGISNYPEVTVEDECMFLPESGETMSGYYDRKLNEALAKETRPAWIREYSIGAMHCDPCTGIELGDQDALDLGYTRSIWDSHLTRLHLRYDPTKVDQDLVFYTGATGEDPDTGFGGSTVDQIRFIQYNADMEDRFPVCEQGMVANPGTCPTEPGAEALGCSVSKENRVSGGYIAALLLGLGLWRRRKV